VQIDILMPALSPISSAVMARLDRAIHLVFAPVSRKLDGSLSRAMTVGG